METDRYCTVCNDLASYFCRLCSTHYCAAHLCLHLSVAWESNSWTKRNEKEIDNENTRSRESESVQLENSENATAAISSNAKSVATYSQTQLQAQLQFYMSQARRIRAELERRAVFIESVPKQEIFQRSKCYKDGIQKQPIRRVRRSSIHTTRAISILCDSLRSSNISLEYIIAQINALAKKS